MFYVINNNPNKVKILIETKISLSMRLTRKLTMFKLRLKNSWRKSLNFSTKSNIGTLKVLKHESFYSYSAVVAVVLGILFVVIFLICCCCCCVSSSPCCCCSLLKKMSCNCRNRQQHSNPSSSLYNHKKVKIFPIKWI